MTYDPYVTISELMDEQDYLEDLLIRLMSEVRPYCRPSLVQYDVFPVFKEAVDFVEKKVPNAQTQTNSVRGP